MMGEPGQGLDVKSIRCSEAMREAIEKVRYIIYGSLCALSLPSLLAKYRNNFFLVVELKELAGLVFLPCGNAAKIDQ